MNAVLIVDKPSGITSHDVVARVRKLLRERSVGHLGTLDPMATGVLPLVLGRMTRLAQFYNSSEKDYEGDIRFGFATDTYDAEGAPTTKPVLCDLDLHRLQEAALQFTGTIQQMPPPFSAKKISGVPAYRLARKKREVTLEPVSVEVKELDILDLEGDRASFRARVASGTYLRSVAHDLGRLLGCGGHLARLRRTAVGEFTLRDAHILEAIECAAKAGTQRELFVHLRRILPEFPCVTATEEAAARIRHGHAVNLPEMSRAKQVKVFIGQADLIAIATRVAGTLFHPKIVLAE